MTEELCLIIERDNMTGWTRRLDNTSASPWGDTFTRAEAEASVAWRKAHISGRYTYEVRPVTAWRLDIEGREHIELATMASDTGLLQNDPDGPPIVCIRDDGKPGAQIWAYTRRGETSPPAWLVQLCAAFEDAGLTAGIARPVN